jgi:signal transduction histidine kinase
MQFRAPEDSFKISHGGVMFLDFLEMKNFVSNEYFILPIQFKASAEELTFEAYDLNHNKTFLNSLCLKVGAFNDLRWINAIEWFKTTGINLFSAYFLVLVSFFLLLSLFVYKTKLGLSLLSYSLVSFVYLISFSEYPRAFIDPIVASGGIHFSLRLLQDLSLVYVFYNMYQKQDALNVIKKLARVYFVVIGLYILMLLIGVTDYIYHQRIILLMAPLVATPMTIGTWFAFKLTNNFERKILLPISIVLLTLQLNDLFVFWKVFDGYFTVRFYIPLIVGMVLFIYVRRLYNESLNFQAAADRQKMIKEFIHDVKSPLSVLRTFLIKSEAKGSERALIINSAIDRIEGMVTQIDDPVKNEELGKHNIISLLDEIISQKKLELSGFTINFLGDKAIYSFVNSNKMQRIFSNIINNAFESYSGNERSLDIFIHEGQDHVRIYFRDKGRGIPRSIYKKLFGDYVTSKENGSGVGLKSAQDYLRRIGGELYVVSKEHCGTSVEIKLNTVMGDFDLESDRGEFDLDGKIKLNNMDLVLIDDDKYIRLAWEYYGKNAQKNIKTFSCIEMFLRDCSDLSRTCPVYLDLNINGERSTDHLDKITTLGFKNIFIASGESLDLASLPSQIVGVTGKLPPT